MPDNMNRVLISSDGSILWIPQVTFMSGCVAKAKDSVQVIKGQKILCFLDIDFCITLSFFKYCNVKIGPWTESKQSLEMVASEKKAELEYFDQNKVTKQKTLDIKGK